MQEYSFSYTWERKSVKNINLRVKPDGQVYVSSPAFVSQARIEDFLRARWEFVRGARERAAQRESAPCHTLAEGEKLPVWGVSHTVCHRISTKPRVWCEQGALILAMPDPADESARARAFARFAAAQVREVLSGMTAAYAPLFSVSPPEVTVRAMKRRFASCFYMRDRICYSTSLIFLPMECVELTVCHELAHFRHHDHSAAFYAWLGANLADHRQRRTAMKEIQLPRFAWD